MDRDGVRQDAEPPDAGSSQRAVPDRFCEYQYRQLAARSENTSARSLLSASGSGLKGLPSYDNNYQSHLGVLDTLDRR